jgi:hypothetical protein
MPRDEGHQTVDHAAEIHAHDPVIVGETCRVGRAEHAYPGVVHQDMDGTDLNGDLRPAAAVADVQRDKTRHGASVLLEPRLRPLPIVIVAVCQNQIDARGAEGAGDAKAYARHAAGDQRSLALPFHNCTLACLPNIC